MNFEVALSRVRSLEGLSLDMPLSKEQVKTLKLHRTALHYIGILFYVQYLILYVFSFPYDTSTDDYYMLVA